jgi:YgiT-type zinc finger domain-containing protein
MDEDAGGECACGGKMRKVKTRLELFGGDIVINDVDAFYCPTCEEELLTTKQVSSAQEKLYRAIPGFETYSIRKRITQVGNSLAVPLSKELADHMGLKKGGEVRITFKNKHRLIVDIA